jgi:tetratricopeptide (TPR) repeat protein
MFCFVIMFAVCASATILPGGCSSSSERHSTNRVRDRNQQLAAELTRKAADLMWEDPIEAERILQDALEADLYHGPAHNNLGVLLLNRGELYLAAEEFDWARRLMPGHPDPRINLGIALEHGGKIDDALEAYATALEVYPNHLPAIQALARCQIRNGMHDEYTDELLRIIIFRSEDQWKSWARGQISSR